MGVASPVPAPINTAASRMPPTPGSRAPDNSPSAAIPIPVDMPALSLIRPASRARPAQGWTNTPVTASRDTAAPVTSGVIPASPPTTGRNPTPTASAAVAPARVIVGARNALEPSRLARSTTVCCTRGNGTTVGTVNAAHPVTTRASPARVANSRVYPPAVIRTAPTRGPTAYPRLLNAPYPPNTRP